MKDPKQFELDMIDARIAVSQVRLMFEEVARQLRKLGEPPHNVNHVALRLQDAELMLLRLTAQVRDESPEIIETQDPVERAAPSGETLH